MDAYAINKQVATPRMAGAGGRAETFWVACHTRTPASESPLRFARYPIIAWIIEDLKLNLDQAQDLRCAW